MTRALVLVLLCLPAFSMERISGWCSNGGVRISTAGVSSTTRAQASYPGCTVTVYNRATVTLSTIYSTATGTAKSNPFTAATTNGYWFFYIEGRVDVQLSGGSPSFPAPVTLSDLRAQDVVSASDFGAVADNATDNATAFAAVSTFANANPRTTIEFNCGTYLYTTGLTITQPVTLDGLECANLNYSGSVNAITLGPTGLISGTRQDDRYTVRGFRFIGGASASTGIRVNAFLTSVLIEENQFWNFNPSSAVMSFAGNNWDTRINRNNVDGTRESVSKYAQNVVYMSTATNLNSSKLTMLDNHFSAYSNGWGVRVRGANGVLIGNKIEGYEPNVWIDNDVDNMSVGTVVAANYFEAIGANTVPCIGYSGDSRFFIDGNYCNVHNTDLSSTSPFLGNLDSDAGTIIQYSTISNNTITALKITATQVPVVRMSTTTTSQPYNIFSNNRVYSSSLVPAPEGTYLAQTSGPTSFSRLPWDIATDGLCLLTEDWVAQRWCMARGDQGAVNHAAWGGYATYVQKSASGTHLAPTAKSSSDILGEYGAVGYDGAAYKGGGGVRLRTTEGFGASNHGTRLEFYVTPNASSAAWTALNPAWFIDQSSMLFNNNQVAFASLGTPSNGTLIYCTDCKKGTDPCATSGGTSTGVFAKREGGAWRCN